MKKELEEYTKALFVIDMNNGFVNFGPLANTEYRDKLGIQRKIIDDFRKDDEFIGFVLDNHDKDAVEFQDYDPHCIKGTKEAELVPELKIEQDKDNTGTYYKNCTNGMLNRHLQDDLIKMENLKMAVVVGVLFDICVKKFALTGVDYFQEINRDTVIVLVKEACDTYNAPDHIKDEIIEQTINELQKAGVVVVDNFEELKKFERGLVLK